MMACRRRSGWFFSGALILATSLSLPSGFSGTSAQTEISDAAYPLLGYGDGGIPPPKPLLLGKSIENNADIFVAFRRLAEIERGLGNPADADLWTARADVAGDFVIEMFDPITGSSGA